MVPSCLGGELRSVSPSPVPSKKVSGPDFDRPSQLAEAAGDLFLPSEKGSPPRRGSLSPARGSRRTFSARRSLGAHRSTPDESLLSLFSEKTPIHSRSVFYARSTFSEAPQGAALLLPRGVSPWNTGRAGGCVVRRNSSTTGLTARLSSPKSGGKTSATPLGVEWHANNCPNDLPAKERKGLRPQPQRLPGQS